MAFFGYLFGEEPEGENAPEDEEANIAPKVQVQVQRQGTPDRSRAALDREKPDDPTLGRIGRRPRRPRGVVDDASSTDSDGVGGLSGACVPLHASITQISSHVILRVKCIFGVLAEDCEARSIVDPGRHGMSHFLDCSSSTVVTATVAVIHTDQEPPFEARRKRCVQARKHLIDVDGKREASWENDPGEVRAKLRLGATSTRVALVVGTEVIGLTRPISLSDPARRFFKVHEVFRPGKSQQGPGEVIGAVRVAFELWPPGSNVVDQREITQFDTWVAGKATFTGTLDEEERSACGFCDGLGRKQCGSCFGHGILVCTACDGTPALPCTQCKGTGIIEQNVQAMAPRQRGVTSMTGKRCTTCWGSSIVCTQCFGMGGLRCASCSGAGWIPCNHCAKKTQSVWY